MSPRHFKTGAENAKSGVSNPVEIPFTLDEDELVAYPPTAGQLALFVTRNSKGGVAAIDALFAFMGQILDDEGFDILMAQLGEGMDVTVVTDIVQYLIEEWSAHPTNSSSGSSVSRKTTGGKSTASARSKAKTAS